MTKNKKKILIIGGAGFIGKNLIQSIDKKKYQLYVLDKNKEINKNKLFFHNCKILSGNISDPKTFKKLNLKFYKVFFLAAQSSTFLCEKFKDDCFKSNFLGLINFYNWALNYKPENIIFTSSMAVYGVKADRVNENGEIRPISMYANSKVLGEKLLSSLKYKKINIMIFRLFNVYGPMQDLSNKDQGMLSIYLSQIKEKNKVTVKGSLDRYRDFVYIDDVIKILNKDYRSCKYTILNIGTGKKTTVRQLINLLFKFLKIKSNISIISSHKGDSFGSYANINRLKELDMIPKVNLTKGIGKTLKYFYK